jgi:hypothetical protein
VPAVVLYTISMAGYLKVFHMLNKLIFYCAATVVCFNLQAQRKNVAIVIFNDVQIIDYTGPYEVFGQTGYNVFTVAADTNTIITSMKMKVIPSYSFNNAPKADIIVVPGGGIRHDLPKSDPIVQWILSRQDKAVYWIIKELQPLPAW